MSPPGHGRLARLLRWGLVAPLLLPLLLFGGLEAAYRSELSHVGELPRPPRPRVDFAHRVLWLVEDGGPLQLEPLWPWRFVHEGGRRSAGASLAASMARLWLASRPGPEGQSLRHWHLHTAALSIWLSRHWTAEELLTAYADRAHFGHGLIGLPAASRRYFGKEPAQLAPHEAALLAGLLQSPSRFDPLRRPDAALQRRQEVLARLLSVGWISPARYAEARRMQLLPSATASEAVRSSENTPGASTGSSPGAPPLTPSLSRGERGGSQSR